MIHLKSMRSVLLLFVLFIRYEPKDELKESIVSHTSTAFPDACRYFIDGNLSREEMVRDLESMNDDGIINLIFLEMAYGWINCLLGDQQEPDTHVRTVKFENGPMGGKECTSGRYTFTTKASMRSFKFTEPLFSRLVGPVNIQVATNE